MQAFMLLDEPTFLDMVMLFLDALASIYFTKSHCHSFKLCFIGNTRINIPLALNSLLGTWLLHLCGYL